ncbi:MAG: putative Rossmann-fold nucleotide-binding protein [Paracoccaceae bacterium]|jgi:predicted Rossmann-fold nucleotide-binding protein
MKCAIVRELDSLDRLVRLGPNLNCTVIQGLDLREADLPWKEMECDGAVFLGCQFPPGVSVCDLMDKGALIFPKFSGLPFSPYRPELYTREELMKGWSEEEDQSVDKKIYDHFVKHGKKAPDIVEALAERLHDHAIDDGLTDLLEGRVEKDGVKKVVAIMGGHGTGRDDDSFRKVTHLARRLTLAGYFIASGGGPGIMEAANLGAYLAEVEEAELDAILDDLASAPKYTDQGYVEAAHKVIAKYPTGHSSLAVPTWFYGHEPTNMFSAHVAKYFSNSIREDGLLAIARYGIIFAPGRAGTTQEIFQDACKNHYASSGEISPMVFLNTERYTKETPLWETINKLADGRHFKDLLFLSDEVEEIVTFIRAHPPVPSDGLTSPK